MSATWQWPGDAEAAVSLTYDDGYENHLDHAMPDLEGAGFRGTFYLWTGNPQVSNRRDDWRNAHLNGHEIGNHSTNHTCRGLNELLLNYTALDIRNDVYSAATWLNQNIGMDSFRTFAYPCGDEAIAEPPDASAYAQAVHTCHFAARTAGGGPNDPIEVAKHPLRIAAQAIGYPHGTDLAPFIAYCEAAVQTKGWAVIVFHSIGAMPMPTDRLVHQQLLAHLQDRRFWVAPVRDVARYILTSISR